MGMKDTGEINKNLGVKESRRARSLDMVISCVQ